VVAVALLPACGAAGPAGRSGPGPGAAAAAASGTLLGWGVNADGQLGTGSIGDGASAAPVRTKLPPGTPVVSARGGCAFGMALTATGAVLAWGDNEEGQLGDGSTAKSLTPVRVRIPAGARVTAIQAGCNFALALTAAGRVLAWGENTSGQLGNGSTVASHVPVQVRLPAATRVTGIRSGFGFSLATTAAGRLLAWGENGLGQLGIGSLTSSRVPVSVRLPGGARVTSIAAGANHSLALTRSGRVLAWGFNTSGELGDGTARGIRSTPAITKLPRGTRVQSLAAGCDQSLALTATGRVLAWGENKFGQLGTGSADVSSDTPGLVHLPRGAVVTAISAGCTHDLAQLRNGKVLAWGERTPGQLGDGILAGASRIPVPVRFPAGQVAISIGSGPTAENSFAITRRPAR
jgi:alpha-tubulin suppressor-like RCC1 family protein